MKGKIFKKVIASVSAVSMLASMAFAIPAGAAVTPEKLTYSASKAATTVSDSNGKLVVNGYNGAYKKSYVQFDGVKTGMTADGILSAELTIYPTSWGKAGRACNITITGCTPGFTSDGVVLTGNAPALGDVAATHEGVTTDNQIKLNAVYSTDITKYMKEHISADGSYAFELSVPNSNPAELNFEATGDNAPKLIIEYTDATVYTVTYDVNGIITTEKVVTGDSPVSVPDPTRNDGYDFTGWKVGDTDTILADNDAVKAQVIESNVTYTAQYRFNPEWIEPVESVSISGADSMTFGPDPDTPASNPYTVVIKGITGTTITENNLHTNVTDFNVVWDADGFKSENDSESQYCDSYGSFAVNNTGKVDTDFELRNIPRNFYGIMTATVTYNGKTYTAKKAVVALGNKTRADVNQILPEAGYPSDFDDYPDSLIDYHASFDTYGAVSDLIAGGWVMSGSDSGTAVITEEDGNKFIKVTANNAKKSHMFAKAIASPTKQVIFEQDVRFNSTGGCITLNSKYPFYGTGTTNPVTLLFDGTNLWLNKVTDESGNVTKGEAVKDNSGQDVTISNTAWYKVVLSVDKTNETVYVKVYDANGSYVGGTGNVPWKETSTPTFYSIGLANDNSGTIDFDKYSAYYPTADINKYNLTTTLDTLSIPNGDTAELSASLQTAEGYDITGAATWIVLEEDMQEGVIVTPDEEDSHKAHVSLAPTAVAGEATVQVNIGGYTKSIVLNITSSAESVKFTKSSTGIAIPLDDSVNTAEYKAIVVSGDGTDLNRETTLAVYDKTNTSEYTLPDGITFDAETGILSVTKEAPAVTFTIRATGKNSDNENISKGVKVTVHGLSFDFGASADDVAEGYTAITPTTSYKNGYGIKSGSVTAGGTPSLEDADSDYLEGAMTFNVDVEKGKIYTVEITYQGEIRTGYVNSDLASYPLETTNNYGAAAGYKTLTKKTYTVAVPVDTLDLIVSDYVIIHKATVDGKEVEVSRETYPARVASITITKNPDKQYNSKPDIHHVGDSTAANSGSWAYQIDHNRGSYPALQELATFYNNGAGGRNLSSFYTEGKLANALKAIEPGDILMFGNNGTNGQGSHFEADVNYYLDAAEAMGAKIIINSYTPDGGSAYYDSTTKTFHGARADSNSGEGITRKVAAERAESDPNYIGFVEIGRNADIIFNAYVADYAANNYASEDEAAAAITSCFTDHNHYSNGALACNLMLNGYNDSADGVIAQLVDILETLPARHTITFVSGTNATVTVNGQATTSLIAEAGSSVNFKVNPASGYAVTEVSDGTNTLEAVDGVYTLEVSGNTTVTITTARTGYTVNFAADNAAVTVDGKKVSSATVALGGTLDFTVAPNSGYKVTGVTADNATVSGSDGEYTLSNVTADTTVTITTEALPKHKVTFAIDGEATVSVGNEVLVADGDDLSFSVTPGAGHNLVSVKAGELELTAVNGVYTLNEIREDVTITITTEVDLNVWIEYHATYDATGKLTSVTVTPNATPQAVTNTDTDKTFYWNAQMKPWSAE